MSRSNRILAAIAVLAAIVGIGGYGATMVMKRRAIAEVEDRFAILRTVFAKAEHGDIDFDIWERIISIQNILLLAKDAAPDTATTIAKLTALGVNREGATVTADRVELRDLRAIVSWPPEAAERATYEVPTIVADRVGLRPPAVDKATSMASAALRIFEATSVATVTMPTVKASTKTSALPSANPAVLAPSGSVEQTQYNVRIEGIKDGRIARMSSERLVTVSHLQPAGAGDFEGEFHDAQVTGYDLAGLLSLFDRDSTATPPSTGYATLWQSAAVGGVTIKVGKLATVTLAGLSIDKGGFDGAKFRRAWDAVQATQPKPGATVAPMLSRQQQLAVANAVADLYDAIYVDGFECHGFVINGTGMPPMKLDHVGVSNFKDGAIGSLEFKGLDGMSPQIGEFKLGRLLIKDMKLAELMRLSARMPTAIAAGAQPNQLFGDTMQLISGVEMDDLAVPDKRRGGPIVIHSLKAHWGTFVGSVPTAAQFGVKVSGPISATDPEPFASLARTGMKDSTLALDGRWQWEEAAQKWVIGPIEFDQPGITAATARMELTNVSRQSLLGGLANLPAAASQMYIGPVAVMLRDQGLMKLVADDPILSLRHQQALTALKAEDPAQPPVPAEFAAIKAGLARFIEAPGNRLNITLTPKVPLTLAQLMAAGKTGPELAAFLAGQIDANVVTSPAP